MEMVEERKERVVPALNPSSEGRNARQRIIKGASQPSGLLLTQEGTGGGF